jgi:hypothetical protein
MDTNAEEVARLPVMTTHKVNRSAFLYHKRGITESHSKIFLTVRCVETNLPNETIQVVQIKNIKVSHFDKLLPISVNGHAANHNPVKKNYVGVPMFVQSDETNQFFF